MTQTLCAVASWGRMAIIAIATILFGGQAIGEATPTKVVQNDRGGYVGARALELAEINAQHTRIELRGRICYSSCTMYLGAADLCVSATTTFGFHGPSKNGRALPVAQFDHWSDVMAQHYNPALRQWFMQKGRFEISDYFRISGAQLIAMGYTACT